MRWRSGTDILVGAVISDNEVDGKAPTLVIIMQEYTPGGVQADGYKLYELRNMDGGNTIAYRSILIPLPSNWYSAGLKFRVCNGKGTSGPGADAYGNLNCGTTHGWFRP